MEKEKSFGYKTGRFLANVLIACVTTCLSAVAIALTVRFIMFLF